MLHFYLIVSNMGWKAKNICFYHCFWNHNFHNITIFLNKYRQIVFVMFLNLFIFYLPGGAVLAFSDRGCCSTLSTLVLTGLVLTENIDTNSVSSTLKWAFGGISASCCFLMFLQTRANLLPGCEVLLCVFLLKCTLIYLHCQKKTNDLFSLTPTKPNLWNCSVKN